MAAVAYALLGPTASGKSAIALAAARERALEIVSMDSALVYRGMDIGTAKPTAAERAAVPHHLIDLVDPHEAYSAGRWRQDAITTIQAVIGRGRIPLIVGGTMLYYRALAAGLDALPSAEPEVRAAIDAEGVRRGWPALHAELAAVDPASAARIKPNDAQRIQRALEVWRLTGKPLSSLQGTAKNELPFALRAFSIVPDREELKRRIEARFDAMLKAGLVDELKRLRTAHALRREMPSMRCVGYRQAWEYLEGEIGEAELRKRAVAATRQLAKRQLTWLRSFRDMEPLEPSAHALAARLSA